MSHLENITAEQRQEMVEKSKEKRRANAEWAREHLVTEYADDKHWRELASKYNYRLPTWYSPASSKHVNRFLRNFNLTKDWYQDHTGYLNGNEEARKNPTMNSVQQVGLLLECYNEDVNERRTIE